jgi:hypothetical protein
MARLRRRGGGDYARQGLTTAQRTLLLVGLEFIREPTFESPAECEAVWRAHRNELVFACGPFKRPDAFWFYETEFSPPMSLVSERELILRLGLPLSSREKTLLADEQNGELQASVTSDSPAPGPTEQDELFGCGVL